MPFAGRFVRLLFGFVAALVVIGAAPPAQSPLITMTLQAGYDGHFRDSQWMPVIVQIANGGDPIQGALVIRPETSGNGLSNTFSAPVDLPTGANQTVTLYITARAFTTQVRVELMDFEGVVIEAASAPLRAIQPLDWLSVVVSQSAVGTMDVTGAKVGGYDAYQANWRVQDLPDRAGALSAVDVLLFSEVDTGALSPAQRVAVGDWVAEGGHLIVTGGAPWQPTAAGLTDLLPFKPTGSSTVDDLMPLADWLRRGVDDVLGGQTVIATGTLNPNARLLVERDGAALLARQSHGAGVVDYLTADPNSAPLRGWNGLTDLWLTLQTTRDSQPSWSYGFTNWDAARSATEVLPGYNLLPDALPLCGFLALYIGLIGPINYLILARLNRRELAWLTIPALIVVFSALAWALGFNLRGTEATLSRLTVVRSWPDVEQAQVDGLVGLLSPRRAEYALTLADNGLLRPIPRPQIQGSNLLASNVQASVDVQQSDVFKATDFLVDASFIAGFNTSAQIAKPAIDGTASISYEGDSGQQHVRGSVRNRSDQTLSDPVILARGATVHLDGPLAPGGVATFDVTLSGEGPAAPAAFSPAAMAGLTGLPSYYSGTYGIARAALTTAGDILGNNEYLPQNGDSLAAQENRRRWLFLGSFINDFYTSAYNSSSLASTGRGDRVYLAGWTDSAPLPVTLDGAQWGSENSTLYLIELDAQVIPPTSPVTISADRFTWLTLTRTSMTDEAPTDLSLQPGEQVTFRFTPLPDAVLSQVNRLRINVRHSSLGSTSVPVFLYDWDKADWEQIDVESSERVIDDPARFLGPENAVIIQLNADSVGGYLRVDQLSIEQEGDY